MNITILSGNPKIDGLCQGAIEEIKNGIKEGKASYNEIRLCDHDLLVCQVCDEGWGTCRDENYCKYGDDGFEKIHSQIKESDAIIMVTPVYWGEVSESLKLFIDRVRRCDFNNPNGAFNNKEIMLVASAGGTGNGILTALSQMERFCMHVNGKIFDKFGINRWNKDYKFVSLGSATKAFASGRKSKVDI